VFSKTASGDAGRHLNRSRTQPDHAARWKGFSTGFDKNSWRTSPVERGEPLYLGLVAQPFTPAAIKVAAAFVE
jgi:hypothetical protein